MDKKILSIENFIKLGILLGALFTFGYDIKTEVRELIINSKADGRINEQRFSILEASTNDHGMRLNDIDKWRYRVDAILPDEPKIKRK